MAKDAKAALSGKPKKKRAPNMHIRPTANGGYIASHDAADASDPNGGAADAQTASGGPQEYGLSDKAALMAHMQQHIPDDESTEAGPQ